MNVNEAREVRAAAALARADGRADAASYAAGQSDLRKDQRIEEAREADVARSASRKGAASGLYVNILV